MHTKLSQHLLNEFIYKSEDTFNQIIFTAHDVNLLNLNDFRQDEIWFVEKTQLGESKLKPLSDFNVKEGQDTLKAYLNGRFGFEKYPEDEFWIVTDVDNNWSHTHISDDRTFLDEWNEAISLCEEKNYNYAVSNPFFELWLLLHHDDCSDDDKRYAVTDEHDYEPTSHFRDRLRGLDVPLKDRKHINFEDYTEEKIVAAIERAKQLHTSREDLQPHYLATTVYMLLEKITALIQE